MSTAIVRVRAIAAALVATLSFATPVSADTMIVGDKARTYTVTRPPSSSRAPLVLVLHGGGGNGQRIAEYTGWSSLAKANGFAATFPDAMGGNWEFASAVVGAPGNPDLRFLNKLIATLVADGTADPRRVYITGLSRGGAMTYAMVCGKAQLFAAAAPVITGAAADLVRTCRPFKPVPMLVMNGTADKLIPYDGGRGTGPTADVTLMPVPDFMAFWRTTNGCSSQTTGERVLPDLDPADKSRVTIVASACPESRDVVHYRIDGGGHQQPRRPAPRGGGAIAADLGPQNHDIDGAAEIWSFFKRFSL